MSDQDASTTEEASTKETTDTQEDQTTDDASETEEDDADLGEQFKPEVARKQIHKLLKENRSTRERAAAAEKKAEGVDEVKQQNVTLGSENLRLKVGYELGLPMSLALRLQGETKEEMLADAEALVELVAPTKRPATRKPAEALRGGLEPDKEPEETDTRKIAERMFRS